MHPVFPLFFFGWLQNICRRTQINLLAFCFPNSFQVKEQQNDIFFLLKKINLVPTLDGMQARFKFDTAHALLVGELCLQLKVAWNLRLELHLYSAPRNRNSNKCRQLLILFRGTLFSKFFG
jgi:hypothetical protein